MRNYFDKNLIQQVFNSNEFKGWLLSRRWFGDKSSLSNLAFRVTLSYFKIVSERIFLTIIVITTQEYTKAYFLPMVSYEKIQEILEPREKTSDNIVKLTENTYSKMVALNVYDNQKEKIISLNLVEAEYCVFFWKKMLFDKKITETFPSLSMELTLYSEQFEDDINMKKVRNLIEASLYPERYEYGLEQLGGGNTTNLLFSLKIYEKNAIKEPISYILKSYKDYSGSLEPKTLFVLVKNNFPNAPKIYGTIKLQGKETIGILEDVSNIGNLGDIYWNEVNEMVNDVFKRVNDDYSYLNNKEEMSNIIKKHCVESLKISEKIGFQIKKLHKALILTDDPLYSKQMVDSKIYLKEYTDNLNSMVSKILNYTTSIFNRFYTTKATAIICSILSTLKEILSFLKKKGRLNSPSKKI
jgi:hypothetical protein